MSEKLPTGRLEDCGCGPGANEVNELSGLGAASPGGKAARIESPVLLPPMPKPKRKKPRSKGTGPHCVTGQRGNVVHCYIDKSVAERVAKAFGKRSGATFKVRKR